MKYSCLNATQFVLAIAIDIFNNKSKIFKASY